MLYDPDVLLVAMDHNFTSVLSDLFVRSAGSDAVQRLASVGLENLSHQSENLSQPPSEERRPEKENILRRLRDAHAGRVHNNRKPPAHGRLCPVHCGVCSPATTFCLVEAFAVEGLLSVLEINENGCVVEAALGALCMLLDNAVGVESGVPFSPSTTRRGTCCVRCGSTATTGTVTATRWCFWAVERFLTHGGERCMREVTSGRVMPSALVSAFHKGDAATKQVAESMLRSLHCMPDYSTTYVSVEL